jgi:hypothetical protein
VTVVTAPFAVLAEHETNARGLPDARYILIEHPLGGSTDEQVAKKAAQAYELAMQRLGAEP